MEADGNAQMTEEAVVDDDATMMHPMAADVTSWAMNDDPDLSKFDV